MQLCIVCACIRKHRKLFHVIHMVLLMHWKIVKVLHVLFSKSNWICSYQNPIKGTPSKSYKSGVENMYLCSNPMNPTMKSLQNRVQSFYSKHWNLNFLEASPEKLAEFFTGKLKDEYFFLFYDIHIFSFWNFFVLGRSDRVKCWYCNGGLQSWEYTDSPIIEHAKWYPRWV